MTQRKKSSYLFIDNGHGRTIIDITKTIFPWDISLETGYTEEELMKFLQEECHREVWRIFGRIEKSDQIIVHGLFNRSADEDDKAFIKKVFENEPTLKIIFK